MVSNRNLLFQGFIFRCYVSFRECTLPKTNMTGWNIHHEWVDVFPIEKWRFSNVMLVFRGCRYPKKIAMFERSYIFQSIPRFFWVFHVEFKGCFWYNILDVHPTDGPLRNPDVWIPPGSFTLAPENIPSQKESSFPTIIFQGLCWTSGGYPNLFSEVFLDFYGHIGGSILYSHQQCAEGII